MQAAWIPVYVHMCYVLVYDTVMVKSLCPLHCIRAGYDLVEIASFNAASLDAGMTRRVFQEHGLQAACSLGLTLDADISSDSAEVRFMQC
jgi:hypothetical protein